MAQYNTAKLEIKKFTNCTILRNHELIHDDLWVRGRTIIDPVSRFWEAADRAEFAADVVIDCKGLILAPGYIDIQLNGAFGIDFSSPQDMERPENIRKVCEGVTRHGVTSFYATIITSAPSTYAKLRPLVTQCEGSAKTGAHILGLHLEGPFITVPGAHPPSLIRGMKRDEASPQPPAAAASSTLAPAFITASSTSPSPQPPHAGSIAGLSEVFAVYGASLSDVGIITLAPEIEGTDEVIRTLSAPPHNIVISAGHSRATYNESVRAVESGASLVTHLFNAMVSFHHRDPGLIGLIGAKEVTGPRRTVLPSLSDSLSSSSATSSSHPIPSVPSSLTHPPPPRLFYSLIVDGHHTHPASVKIAYSTHPRGAILITDAMCAMGLQDGQYKLGETTVDIKDDMAHVAGTSTLAGSIATMEKCVQNFYQFTGCTLVEAIETATLHPAQCMNLNTKGTLEIGMDADLILLDEKLKVHGCWILGDCAWKDDDIKSSCSLLTQK